MPNQLIDRWNLRRLSKSLYKERFENQNLTISDYLNIHPIWLKLSRLNYQYIFCNPKAFWPDWAIKQFNPIHKDSTTPINELNCLNFTHRNVYTFFSNSDPVMEINSNGFMSFPRYGWGVILNQYKQQYSHPFFEAPLTLSPTGPFILSEQKDQYIEKSVNISFDPTNNSVRVFIKLTNHSNTDQHTNFSVGVVPYINEGVGGIKHLQYLSNQELLINDSTKVCFSKMPDNILCTEFNQGNIFKLSQKWQMILNAKCPDYLASGLVLYSVKCAPHQSEEFTITIHLTKDLLTPLFYPLKKIKSKLLNSSTPSSVDVSTNYFENTAQFKLSKPSIPLFDTLLSNFYTQYELNHQFSTSDSVFFNFLALCRLNNQDESKQFLNHFFTTRPKLEISFLNASQTNTLVSILIFHLFFSYFKNNDLKNSTQIFELISKNFNKDPFIIYIKRLSFSKFVDILNSKKRMRFFLKFIIFNYFINNIAIHEHFKAYIFSEIISKTFYNFMDILMKDSSLIDSLVEEFKTTTSISLQEKLFLMFEIMPFSLSENHIKSILDHFTSLFWINGQFINLDQFSGVSEKETGLFLNLTNTKIGNKILDDYLSNVNTFGNYENQKSIYNTLRSFPHIKPCFHSYYINYFLDNILSVTNKTITINIIHHFSIVSISNINTLFGTISITLNSDKHLTTLKINHQFNYSPDSILVNIPSTFNSYTFDNSVELNTITGTSILLPLNVSTVTLK